MAKQTDFRPIIKRLLESGKYSRALLAHECDCTESHIRKMLGDRLISPNYDMGKRLTELDKALTEVRRKR
jgi:hypothetical protein